ncbi:MAG TPA: glycosyltransferase family 4 protein, partial [Steroidobacteraceae bacterium]|nr:glycosyltransferase family 4 protein [Steroidobacteraceae bacterium]
MNYLFIHQNFPAQYRHVVRHLATQPGHTVVFITQPNDNQMSGVRKVSYPRDERGPINCHAYSMEIDRAIHTGATVAEVCRGLREQGFRPDLIVGHSGWGETLFIKDVWPDVPLLANFEFYYHARGVDVDFDPEFVSIFNDPSKLRARNATNLLAFEAADWGHSATRWQRSLYPQQMQPRISVLHEGVDTALARPHARARFRLPGSRRVLTRRDEVITYVARNLEPYRGFHIFMRALPQLLRRRPHAQVVIVGGDGVSYGAPPPPRSTFREMMLQELGSRLDPERVHFTGLLDHASYLALLQVSSVHAYLTYPFVLSWSFIEALACGCLIVGSATPPVLEVLRDGVNGLTVDFFSPRKLANRIEAALEDPERMTGLRAAARQTAVREFDLQRVLLPRWMALFDDLIHRRPPLITAASVT